MKTSKLNLALKTIALAGAASMFLTGCLTSKDQSDYTSDGSSAYLTNEVDQMGQVYGQISTGAAAKVGLGILDSVTITGELVIDPFKYHDDCTCFVRKADYTGSKGYERERLDSVVLIDTTGAKMNKFDRGAIAKIIHTRNVTHSFGAKAFDVRFDFTVDIKTEAGAKVGVWNGTMSGTLNGEAFKSGTMTGVTRTWDPTVGHFHFPEAGTIEIDRPVFHILVEFLGDDKARVTITNKLNKKIHIITVDRNYNETEPVAQ